MSRADNRTGCYTDTIHKGPTYFHSWCRPGSSIRCARVVHSLRRVRSIRRLLRIKRRIRTLCHNPLRMVCKDLRDVLSLAIRSSLVRTYFRSDWVDVRGFYPPLRFDYDPCPEWTLVHMLRSLSRRCVYSSTD